MGGDLPDYTRIITVLLRAEILSQVRQLPWWVRYNPSRVVFLDDFEGVLKWQNMGGTVEKESSIHAFEQSNCLALTTDTIADSGAWAGILFGGMPRSKMALQFRWNVLNEDLEALKYFYVNIILTDGTSRSEPAIRYVGYDGGFQNKWQYNDPTTGYTDIPNAAEVIETDYLYHQLAYLVVDYRSDKLRYDRLVTSKLNLDLTDLPLPYETSEAVPYMQVNFGVVTSKAVAVKAVIDAVLLSDEEP